MSVASAIRKRRIVLGALIALAASIAALAVAAAVALAVLSSRPLVVPDWVKARIEARLAETVPELDIAFGTLRLRIETPARLKVLLWDVDLRTAAGVPVARLSDVAATLAVPDLLRGRPVLRHAAVSGATLTLARREDGRVGLALGDAFGGGRVPDMTEIVATLDRALADPRLARLDTIEADALTLRFEDRRAGRGWTVDGGRVQVRRAGGRLDLFADLALLSGGAGVAALELNAESAIGDTAVDFGLTIDGLPASDIATQSPALAWLAPLDAPISGALRSRIGGESTLGPLSATLQIGAGAIAPGGAAQPVPFDSARAYFTYDPAAATLTFDEIAWQAPSASGRAEGLVLIAPGPNGWPRALSGQLRVADLRLRHDRLSAEAVRIAGADAAFQLDLAPFRLRLGSLRVTDPATPVTASGVVSVDAEGWDVALDARAPRLDRDRIIALWPKTLHGGARDWVTRHVSAATLADVRFALRGRQGARPVVLLDFRFEDGTLRYADALPPVEEARGRMSIHDGRLGLRVDAGTSEPAPGHRIDLAGSSFAIPDLAPGARRGELVLRAAGPTQAMLHFLDNPSWRLIERAGRTPDMIDGTARIAGTVSLPLRGGLKRDDVQLDLAGVLRGVTSATLVPGRMLRAGRLDLRVTDDRVEIAGPVTVDGVPAEAAWRLAMQDGGAEVTADVALSPRTLADFGIPLPPGLLSGSGRGALVLTLPPGGPVGFRLDSDLAGLALDLPQLGWRLPEAATGRFEIAGTLRDVGPPDIERIALDAPGLRAEGRLALAPGGGFSALTLDTLRRDDWLDVSAVLRGPAEGGGLAVTGGTLDLRGAGPLFGGGGDGAAGPPGGVTVALDRVRITEAIVVDAVVGQLRADGGGTFSGAVGGTAEIEMRIAPAASGPGIAVTGRDAGDILEAANLLRNVQDGTFLLTLAPVPGSLGSFDGTLEIEGARLQDAPVMASLLDAVSVVGLIDQLNGPGIFFSDIDARFRLTPDRVILSRGAAVGPSMGLTLDGFYGLADGTLDLQGVVSPVYILNGIGQLVSRPGEGLIGFTFTLRGTRDAPEVGVNPLSVFTPGMFRDIFRRPPPALSR